MNRWYVGIDLELPAGAVAAVSAALESDGFDLHAGPNPPRRVDRARLRATTCYGPAGGDTESERSGRLLATIGRIGDALLGLGVPWTVSGWSSGDVDDLLG